MHIERVVLAIFGRGGFSTNCYLLSDDGSGGDGQGADPDERSPGGSADGQAVWVIDPADDWPRLQEALAGRAVEGIICTHQHFDHVRALGALYLHSLAPIYVARDDADAVRQSLSEQLAELGQPTTTDLVTPLEDGDFINIGHSTLEVIETPGHTAGSICLHDEDDAVLFSGDTLFRRGIGRTDLPTGDAEAMRESLKLLAALPPQTAVYPGHGEATTIGAELS